MSNALFVQPPLTAGELFARGARTSASVIPPLGLAYIASYLKKNGHHCEIVDGIATQVTVDEISAMARRFDVVGVTAVSTYALRSEEVVRALKKNAPEVPVVVGGPHVTAVPEDLLRSGADFAVIGEGEATTLELVEALANGSGTETLKQIRGVAFMDGGEYFYAGKRERIAPLDEIPLPARDLLPMNRYRSSIARSTNQPSHSMLASRGCPGVCSFCNKRTFGTNVRYFSVERIVEEFFLLRDKYGAKDVAVWDDNFLSDPEVVMGVCDELERKKLGLSWSVEARVDGIRRDVVKALRRAGCSYIALGIESGSPRVLEYMKKNTDLEQIRTAVKICHEEGLLTRGYFMMGLPGETAEEMNETVKFAKQLNVTLASFTLFVPLPGTLEYRRASDSGQFDPLYYKKRIVPEFNFLDEPVYVPEGMTAEELIKINQKAYQSYYFRPSVILKKILQMRSPGELLAALMGAFTLISNFLYKKKVE